ncbi:hypothetical protein [Enterocloster clostridioformis]|uniref:hypothetical protein n=1 Tax=Enterocloster clostridioformis TaxID=1531 RepID=UPI0040642D11
MANFEINEDQAALIRELRKLEISDPVHANVYNALFEKLINNDAFLERLANKMIEKSMLCHVLDSVNSQQVLAADVGPKITAIIDGLQEDVNGLNTNLTTLYTTRWTNNVDKITVGPGTVVTTEIAVPTISGYTPIGAIGFSTKQGLSVYQCSIDGQNKVARVYVYNGTSSTITNEIGQAGIHILYLRNFIK